MHIVRRAVPIAAAAIALLSAIGCGSRADPPATPTVSLVPEVVGLAVDLRSGDCGSLVYTLDSGQVVTKFPANVPAGCDSQPTRVVLGQPAGHSTSDGVNPVVLAGRVEGATWIGTAPWDKGRKGWCVIFNAGDGAYLEGASFHLASGLVAPLAPDFHWLSIDRSDLLPLRSGDDFCLNEQGQVVGINVWTSY
jgi:hypothetical protein